MPGLIGSLKKLIFSDDFKARHREKPSDFIRQRKMPFHALVLFLLNMNKGSYQDELDKFYENLLHLDVAERILFKGSLSKARKKLHFEAFIELNQHMIKAADNLFPTRLWHGFRLLAIDGSTLKLPHEAEIINHFGVWNGTKGRPCPKARISQMFDVLNNVTVDAFIKPKCEGERELAKAHFLNTMPKDLLLLDRGYPAFWVFKAIQSMDADFCARVSYKKWKIIRKFYASGEKEAIVKFKPSSTSIIKCTEMGLDKKPIKVRLIRVELDTGETEILITSLKDSRRFQRELFGSLYHLRWPVEEDYKVMKCRLEVENFSGKSVLSIYQDFHAKVVSKNLTAIAANTARKAVQTKSKGLMFEHQINFTQALSKMRHTLPKLFYWPKERVKIIVEKLRKIYIQTTESVRHGRKFPRVHRVKTKIYHHEYKPFA